jgi:diguanylate cyclase (GGDEF)-like protein/PAS domain S-box-containing protein
MSEKNFINSKYFLPPVLVVVILSFIRWQYGVLLFHTLAELFSVMVGVLMLVVSWNTRRFTHNDFLVCLGIGYFWIAVLDTWHTFTVEGMPFFNINDAEITLHFWIYTRFIEAVLLLSAAVFLKKRLNASLLFYGGAALTLLVIWASLALKKPVMLTPEGLTTFKISVEYLVMALLLLSIYVYAQMKELMTPKVFYFLLTSISLTICAEIFFTLYTDFQGIPFVVGHLFKFLSFWMIYQAIAQTTLAEPFSMMAQRSGSYDAIPHPAIVVDNDGVISQVNRAAEQMVGKSAKELVHHHVHQFFHPDQAEDCELCQSIQKGEIIENQEIGFPEDRWFLFSQAAILTSDHSLGVVQTFTDHSKQKHAQQALLVNRRLLEEAQAIAHVANWELDPATMKAHWSDEAFRILDREPIDDVGPEFLGTLLHPEDKEAVLSSLQLAVTHGHKHHMQYRILRPSGEIRWLECQAIQKYDESGKLLKLRGVVQDITKRKQSENALIESEHWFKTITGQSTEGITVADLEGNYTYVNPAFCDMIGYSEQELLKMTVFDVKAPEQDHSSFEKSKNPEKGHSIQVLLQRKDGTTFISEVLGKIIEISGKTLVLGTIRDITEKVKNEEQILTLSLALEQSPVSVVITDTEANIEYVNRAFEQVTGYSSEEVLGRNPRILKSGVTSENLYRDLWKTISSGEIWEGELQNRRKDGEIFWEYAHFSPVMDVSGTIRHYLAVKEDITQRKLQAEQIIHQAHFDALTDLPNRFLSLDRLTQLLNEAKRNDEKVAVLFLDLDDFKKVNDTLGHETGDNLLIESAHRLRSVVRSGDTVGRLGGDEFIVLLGGLAEASAAQPIVENLLDRFRGAFRIDGRELMLTVSIGISVYPNDGDNASELLRNADSAMYHSKELGRNTYSYFTNAMNEGVLRRLALEEQMHGALERGEFSILYQPQFDISSNRIMGAEALVRWTNPALGSVLPTEFIPIAEQNGLIVPLGDYVLKNALSTTSQWQKDHAPEFRIAVNLSPRQFRSPELVNKIKQSLEHTGIAPRHLELEITEGVLLSSHTYIDEALEKLNQLGVSLSMDDFGTGYSSLSYLRNYPFDVLKIDRSFISDIRENPADRELINAAISMAHSLNLKVVAEGVETKEQLDSLKELGCDYAQGYLFSKPLSDVELTKMLT